MSSRTQDPQTQFIPLNKLKKSPRNVRQVPHTKAHIEALADSLEAHAQIQNLVVETEFDEKGRATGFYLVTAGEGRRLAHLLRVKRKKIKADEPIRCNVDDTHNAQAVSLAENILHQQMHPADQYEAFKRLIDSGDSIEKVAAEFGVTPLVVQRRLKLANVAPEFLTLYRKGTLELDHLMALAVTDDHDKQKKAWESLPKYDRSPESLRRALTENEISVREAIVKFVGIKTYEKAGGLIRRDLFAEKQDEGFVMDPELLRRLAAEKLEKAAAQLKEDGYAWVEVIPELDYATRSTYGRVRSTYRAAKPKEQAQLDALKKRLAEIEQEAQSAEEQENEDKLSELSDRAEEVEAQIEELQNTLKVPDPQQQVLAGAVVSIDSSGKLHIEEGLLKPEDASRFAKAAKAAKKAVSGPRTYSAALMRRLTAHRTLALQATLAQRPEVALVALTHRLVLTTFFNEGYSVGNGVQIEAKEATFDQYAPDAQGCKAQSALAAQREALRATLPDDSKRVFAWLLEQPQANRLALFAYCVAVTVNGVQSDEGDSSIDAVAQAAGLDMREWWTVTADSYLGSLPKARILDAVREATSPEAAATLAGLKKAPLAQAAEKRLTGTGWLPSPLRAVAA